MRHKTVQGTCASLDGESVPGAGQWGGRQAEEGGSPAGALVPPVLTSSPLPPWLWDATLHKRRALHPGRPVGALPLPHAFWRPLGLCPWKAWTALPQPALFTQSQDRTEVRSSTHWEVRAESKVLGQIDLGSNFSPGLRLPFGEVLGLVLVSVRPSACGKGYTT